MAGRAGSEFTNYAHGKVAEVEKENAGVEGAHKSEQKAEDAYRFVKRHHKNRLQRRREKVAKLEKKQFQKRSISVTGSFGRKPGNAGKDVKEAAAEKTAETAHQT